LKSVGIVICRLHLRIFLCLCWLFVLGWRGECNVLSPTLDQLGFRLIPGNVLITLGETILLLRAYRTKVFSSLVFLGIANVVSGVVGYALLSSAGNSWLRLIPLERGWLLVAPAILLGLGLTILLEWPFVHAAIPPRVEISRRRRWFRSLIASSLLQCASYGFMVPAFLMTSDFSLYTATEFSLSPDAYENKDAELYFMGQLDGNVYKRRIGLDELTVAYSPSKGDEVHAVKLSSKATGGYGVVAFLKNGDARLIALVDSENRVEGFGENVVDLRTDSEKQLWSATGAYAEGTPLFVSWQSGEQALAPSPPFQTSQIRSVHLLPGGELVAELAGSIFIFSISSRRVCVVCHGVWPVVVPGSAVADHDLRVRRPKPPGSAHADDGNL